jgi:hypothetical protein
MKNELFVTDNDRMAGVRAPVIADDDIGAQRQPINDLGFALVTPLRPDDNRIRHYFSPKK